MQNQKAFTLIEALTVLFIISILLTISMPMLQHFFEDTNENILQSQLQNSIEYARQEARSLRLSVGICKSKNHLECSGAWGDGWIVFIDENDDGIVRENAQILSVVQINSQHGDLRWRSYPRYDDYLSFSPNVLISRNNGTFWHCHANNLSPIWAMMLSKSGKIRLAYPDTHGEIKDGHGKLLACN